MKRSKFTTYSAALLASILIVGCSTAEIVTDKQAPVAQDQNNSTGGGGDNNDTNGTIGTIKIDGKNAYRVSVHHSDEYNQKGYYSVDEIGQITFDITNIYTGKVADFSIIESITLETETDANNAGKYLDFITFDGEQSPAFTIPKDFIQGTDSVAFKIKELAGSSNIIFKTAIKSKDNAANKIHELSVPVVIKENLSTSMSIIPIGSRYENGLFVDKFVIHAVDGHGNKAKNGTRFSIGTINNPKLYSSAYNGYAFYPVDTDDQNFTDPFTNNDQVLPTNEIGQVISEDYGKKTDGNNSNYIQRIKTFKKEDKGSLNKNNSTFELTANNIYNISPVDTLVVLANRSQHEPENLGGWDINGTDGNTTLGLSNLDFGANVNDVSYVIGDRFRFDECNDAVMNASTYAFESSAIVDGIAYAELRYEPSMVGKNVFVYANSQLNGKHVGTSRKVLLTGTGLQTQSISCSNVNGTTPDCSMEVRMVQNDSNQPAQEIFISRPLVLNNSAYKASSTRTDCSGLTTVTIHGIKAGATATINVGDHIADELIVNQQ